MKMKNLERVEITKNTFPVQSFQLFIFSFFFFFAGAKRIANQDLVKLNPLGTNFVNPKHGVLEDQ